MLMTHSADSNTIDYRASIHAMLAAIKMTSGINYFKVAGDPTDLVHATRELGGAVATGVQNDQLVPLIAAVLSAATAYFRAPVGISIHRCEQTHELMVLLYPADSAVPRPQGASLH